jgi:hypothetical protein
VQRGLPVRAQNMASDTPSAKTAPTSATSKKGGKK